jgi:adenylate cyclase
VPKPGKKVEILLNSATKCASTNSATDGLYRFDRYTFDLARGCLSAGGRTVALRPKSFEVLRYLIEHAGRLVSKDELIDAVWPSIVVSDESLAKCVSEVRLALGDSDQRLIKTVPRRGYLFDASVTEEPAGSCEAIKPGETAPVANSAGVGRFRSRRQRLTIIAAGGLAGVILALCAVLLLHAALTPAPTAGRPSVAVLPFANLGDPQQEYFSDGITEDLTTSLGRFSDLLIIGRSSAFKFKGRRDANGEIGRELGARYLVEGSVRRDGDEVRVTAELIEAATGRQLWAETYDRALTGIFSVQDLVVREIVTRLVARLTWAELARGRSKPPETLAAYDYSLRGKALIDARRGQDRGAMVGEARRLFARAVEADPRYAPAVEGLAYSYAIAWLEPTRYQPFRREFQKPETRNRALELAQRAVALDPYLASGHATFAWILHWQYRRDEALVEFERAMELNPNLMDGRFGLMLAHDGRATEAVEFLHRVMHQDPFPPAIYLSYLGNAYFLAGDYEEARRTLETGAERLPDYNPIPVWLAASAALSGHLDEARVAAEKVLQSRPNFTIAKLLEHVRLQNSRDAQHLGEGLREAGLPE